VPTNTTFIDVLAMLRKNEHLLRLSDARVGSARGKVAGQSDAYVESKQQGTQNLH